MQFIAHCGIAIPTKSLFFAYYRGLRIRLTGGDFKGGMVIMSTRIKLLFAVVIVGLGSISVIAITGCQTVWENRNPVGDHFPAVKGKSLSGDLVNLPEAYSGSPVLLLVGYVQETQFDLDRWSIGLVQLEFPDRVVEIPTIPGAVPSLFSSMIDGGMRSGIPSEDWASVVTLYGKAAKPVAELTGNENPRNGRIILLDNDGIIRWFWDEGFSAKRLLELVNTAKALND